MQIHMVNYMLRKAKKKVEYPLSPKRNRVTNGLILSIIQI